MAGDGRRDRGTHPGLAGAPGGKIATVALGLAVAGCDVESSFVSLRLQDPTASYQPTTGTALEVSGAASLVGTLEHFGAGDVATVWINSATIVWRVDSHWHVPGGLSWVSTEQGLPFELPVDGASAVGVRFGGTFDVPVAQLCGARVTMNVYLDLGDTVAQAHSPELSWPTDDPCAADAGTP